MPEEPMTYAGSGVDYGAMDPFKRACQVAALKTIKNILRLGFRVLPESYGESAFLFESFDNVPYIEAHVEEGLGTKNRVADAMQKLTGKSYYDQIAQDTVAMIVNDLITLGALPISVAMHLAVGDSNWFKDEQRASDLVRGWQHACDLARCAWGGGETPTLKDLPFPVLAGSAVGAIKPKSKRFSPDKIQPGDAIIFCESSGIHANGLTLASQIAAKLSPDPERPELGYLTEVAYGRTYGELLLAPTHLYPAFVEDCRDAGNVDIHYAVNITGHGWRKLMRAPQPFAYVIDRLPARHPLFDFLHERGPIDDREGYGNLNEDVGFALYVPEKDVEMTLRIGNSLRDFRVLKAGYVEKSAEKKVVIRPKNIEFKADTLAVR